VVFILIDYGHGAFDLNYRCRAVALYQKLKENKGDISFPKEMHTGMACGNCKFSPCVMIPVVPGC
jgi:urea carboxylase